MIEYRNIPIKYIRQLAIDNEVKQRGREIPDIIDDLIQKGKKSDIEYLNQLFKYKGTNLTILKPEENFPITSNTPEKFIQLLVEKKVINRAHLGKEWRPTLRPEIQICAIDQDGSDIYIKLVEEKKTLKKDGYDTYPSSYASYTSIVIHFADNVIEVRCAFRDREKYVSYVMDLMNYGNNRNYIPATILTKSQAQEISKKLSAGLSSTQIAIPSTVGSMVFNGKKDIDLRSDDAFSKIKKAIEELNLPTDDTMVETCFFKFKCPKTKLEFHTTFEMDLKRKNFKFTSEVPQTVIDHVLDAFILVCYSEEQAKQAKAF